MSTIPDDLKQAYDKLITRRSKRCVIELVWTDEQIISFIERIGRVETERDEYALQDNMLRRAYCESGESGRFTWSGWLLHLVQENAALKAQVERLTRPATYE